MIYDLLQLMPIVSLFNFSEISVSIVTRRFYAVPIKTSFNSDFNVIVSLFCNHVRCTLWECTQFQNEVDPIAESLRSK